MPKSTSPAPPIPFETWLKSPNLMPKPLGLRFKYRLKQKVWVQHKIYGWVQGKVEAKWEFEGRCMYRVVVLKEEAVDMLITDSERHFFLERGA